MADVRYFRAGTTLFKEGEASNSMFLIRKGSVSIRKSKGASTYVEIAKIFPNEVIGELSFFDRQPRSASAVALTEVEAVEIYFDALDKMYDKVPPYLKSILSAVADRLRKADETIRRLQKNIVVDPTAEKSEKSEPDTASILAQTLNINPDEAVAQPMQPGKKSDVPEKK